MMKIEHEERDDRGAFFVDDGGKHVAELTYKLEDDDVMNIDHTETDEKFRGEGIAQDLVKTAVEHARKNKLTVRATCPYAKKLIDKTPEFQDVLA